MLSKKNRIETKYFPEVTRGKTFQTELFRVVVRYDGKVTQPRCAVIVPNKIAKTSVMRNRIRRQVYAVLGEIMKTLPKGFISVFPRKTIITHDEIQEGLQQVFKNI